MEIFTDPEAWVSLITLTVLEIVLGIDNVIFISILSDKLPKNQQEKGRKLGLAMAMITRILLLLLHYLGNETYRAAIQYIGLVLLPTRNG
jgi:predicted tellurium resistance membrane protein TerC